MVEDIIAIIMIFGGLASVAIAYSPVGKAIADRIRGRALEPLGTDPAVLDELDALRRDMAELQERVDFNERLLARGQVMDAADRGAEH